MSVFSQLHLVTFAVDALPSASGDPPLSTVHLPFHVLFLSSYYFPTLALIMRSFLTWHAPLPANYLQVQHKAKRRHLHKHKRSATISTPCSYSQSFLYIAPWLFFGQQPNVFIHSSSIPLNCPDWLYQVSGSKPMPFRGSTDPCLRLLSLGFRSQLHSTFPYKLALLPLSWIPFTYLEVLIFI